MTQVDLGMLGLQEIQGGDVYGGEQLPPLVVALIVAGVGYLAANWSDFKCGLVDGYTGR